MVRVALLAALMLLLAACGRDQALQAFAESRVPPSLGSRFFPPDGWAWGFIQTGTQPMQRYGVAAPSRVPLAVVVIAPGYGESAEVWFETAQDLISRGYTVWILDRAGQGGSERYASPRDAGSVTSFGPDIANLRNLVRDVVKAEAGTPVILVAYADGAVTALRAIETGLRVDGLVSVSPALAPRSQDASGPLGLTRLSRPAPWSRDTPDDRAGGLTRDPWRGQVRKAWQVANPDLRMSEATPAWRAAYRAASQATEAEAGRVRNPVLMLNAQDRERAFCARLSACDSRWIDGALPALHLESDPWRAIFLEEISGFTERLLAERRERERNLPTP